MKWTPPEGFWKTRGLPEPVTEFRFCERLWRFDYMWPLKRIALEMEGGIFRRGGGAHSFPTAILRDMAKHNEATRLGWKIYRFSPEQLRNDMEIERYPKTYKGKRIRVSEFLREVLT